MPCEFAKDTAAWNRYAACPEAVDVAECNESEDLAAPSHQEKTSSTSSDPEEHIAATNPVSLLSVEGQEQAVRAFARLKREDSELDGGDGEDDRSKEPRSVTGEEQDNLMTEEYPEDLHAEFEAWEAPCASPGHA
ncbi:hypothetical protein NDU88_009760 [Pleurodeles waltl]|uniref:Uncharacterized protein n=1 Tax=Pleurodeles waltl TaxID=8319 RepID=A0AAV7QSH2_PLEWA|nr:hypothetical protein NDU88_009760 [Pleurodeles waltl]